MDPLRHQIHNLVEQLSDEELRELWVTVSEVYCDFLMLRSIQAARAVRQPGDTMTREEALRFLSLL